MLELKRIYWTRTGLRLAFSVVMVWLAASAALSLMPKGQPRAGEGASSAAEVLQGMVDALIAAVTLPGAFAVVLIIVAAVINARDVRRRDPIRRFTRQQRREGMARAGGQCEMEAGFRRRCSRSAEHGDHFYPWAKGGPPACKTSSPPAPGATAPRVHGFRPPASRKGWNDDGGTTPRRRRPSASGNGSRSPDVRLSSAPTAHQRRTG